MTLSVTFKATATATVQNTPEYALKRRYWIVTPVKGELWFYSAWDDFSDAVEQWEEDQLILENLEVKK